MNNIEINNIKETALLVILDSVELEKTMSHHDLFYCGVRHSRMWVYLYILFFQMML